MLEMEINLPLPAEQLFVALLRLEKQNEHQ